MEQKDEQGKSIELTAEQTEKYKDVAELLDGAKATIQIAGQNLRTSITDVTEAENLTAALEQGEITRKEYDEWRYHYNDASLEKHLMATYKQLEELQEEE